MSTTLPNLARQSPRRSRGAWHRWAGVAAILVLALTRNAAAIAVTAAPAEGGVQYVLIVNGDDSFTHNYNVHLALDVLPRLGYTPSHTLLVVAGKARDEDAAIRRLPATTAGLDQAMALLQREMRPRDLLLVYLTGHGGRAFGHTFLNLESGLVTAGAFLRRLAPLPFARLILIADQCYSGGFLDEAARMGRDVVGAASADSHHEARCEPFIRPLWQAAVDATSGGGPSSVEQAYRAGADSLASVLRHGEVDGKAQYLATGSCLGHPNRFGFDRPPGAGALAGANAP
jgi:hypothetical protein